LRTV